MIEHTKGICLHTYKYSETSIIVKVFTEKFGLTSYIVKGVRKKRSKTKMAIFQSLTLLDLESSNYGNRSLQFIKELKINNVHIYSIYKKIVK